VNAGAGVKTNLLFFTKGGPTERICYYDLSDVKVGTKSPLTRQHLEEFFRLLPERSTGEPSWVVTHETIDARGYDLKAVNPNVKPSDDDRTPDELETATKSGVMLSRGIGTSFSGPARHGPRRTSGQPR
jgi:type I restriction enzyme M protein